MSQAYFQQQNCIFAFSRANMSLKTHSTKNSGDSDYSKGFEDLLGSQKNLSEQEKKIIEE